MNFGVFAGFALTLLFGIITTYYIVTDRLDKTITDKIKDPKVIRKLVEQVRIPFLIFDENSTYIVDAGGANFIERINISKDGRNIKKITLTLKQKMPVAPILISLNNDVQFFPATPGRESEWEYRTLQFETKWANTYKEAPPPKLFKLDILDIKL